MNENRTRIDSFDEVSMKDAARTMARMGGQGSAETGYCSFEMDLQDKVIVRKNDSEYPATKDGPAMVHDDVVIVYPDQAKDRLRAFYTDMEGNIIPRSDHA
jgi:hypothetical protein